VTINRAHVLNVLVGANEACEAAGLAVVEIVPTAMHRKLLFVALETARSSVIVTSHRMSRQAIGPNLSSRIVRAVERGVDVGLLWGEHGTGAEDGIVEELRGCCEGHAGRLIVNTMPLDLHSKMLVADGESVVITSYEFLNFVDSRSYERDELGVRLQSRRVAAELIDSLVTHIEESDYRLGEQLRELQQPGA